MSIRVAYVGNFDPPHSTENDLAWTLEDMGHIVLRIQESSVDWPKLPEIVGLFNADFLMWTRTGGFDPPDEDAQRKAIEAVKEMMPTVFVHLDRWFGLARQSTERGPTSENPSPCFSLEYLFTADGGHDQEWKNIGANHHWMPPAIAKRNMISGRYRRHLWAEVGFVGNLRGYGHAEWAPYRERLYRELAKLRKFRVWSSGQRGQALADIYASVNILVGDSCLAPNTEGKLMTHYFSDRIPETLGRGGFLIHPHVEGVTPELFPAEVLPTYQLGDFEGLLSMIGHHLGNLEETEEIGEAAKWFVETEHTYHHRMEMILDVLREDGVL